MPRPSIAASVKGMRRSGVNRNIQCTFVPVESRPVSAWRAISAVAVVLLAGARFLLYYSLRGIEWRQV